MSNPVGRSRPAPAQQIITYNRWMRASNLCAVSACALIIFVTLAAGYNNIYDSMPQGRFNTLSKYVFFFTFVLTVAGGFSGIIAIKIKPDHIK